MGPEPTSVLNFKYGRIDFWETLFFFKFISVCVHVVLYVCDMSTFWCRYGSPRSTSDILLIMLYLLCTCMCVYLCVCTAGLYMSEDFLPAFLLPCGSWR